MGASVRAKALNEVASKALESNVLKVAFTMFPFLLNEIFGVDYNFTAFSRASVTVVNQMQIILSSFFSEPL